MQFAFRFQLPKGVTHSGKYFRPDIQTVMCREDLFDWKCRHSLKRSKIGSRVSGRVIRKQRVLVDKVAGK